MLMLLHIERVFAKRATAENTGEAVAAAATEEDKKAPVFWRVDGKLFIIRDQDELANQWLPLFFDKIKWASFIRKVC